MCRINTDLVKKEERLSQVNIFSVFSQSTKKVKFKHSFYLVWLDTAQDKVLINCRCKSSLRKTCTICTGYVMQYNSSIKVTILAS